MNGAAHSTTSTPKTQHKTREKNKKYLFLKKNYFYKENKKG
jgi:hypothetical protein